MYVVGRRVIPRVLDAVAQERELFRLAVLAIALGVAFGAAKLFGVSFALGAFFAGMVLGESELSHRAAEESVPLREAFAVLFFVAVGMLFNPAIVLERTAGPARDAVHHPGRKVRRRLRDRDAVPAYRRRRHDDRSEPVADRRVLVHPRRARRRHGNPARAGTRPGARRGDDLHRPEPVRVRALQPARTVSPGPRRRRPRQRRGRGERAAAGERPQHPRRLRSGRQDRRGGAREIGWRRSS